MSHDDLLNRLREATGADRVLDAPLWAMSDLCPIIDERMFYRRNEEEDICDLVPRYTASLDAAMALVKAKLPDVWYELNGPRKYLHIPTDSPNYWKAKLEPWGKSITEAGGIGWGATPALALLIALLEALNAQEQGKPSPTPAPSPPQAKEPG